MKPNSNTNKPTPNKQINQMQMNTNKPNLNGCIDAIIMICYPCTQYVNNLSKH